MIRSLIKIARLLSTTEKPNVQQGRVAYMGTEARSQVFVPYGMLQRAPDGSMMLLFAQGAHQSNPIGLASLPASRTKKALEKGEVGLANYLTGAYVLFKANGDVEIDTDAKVTIRAAGNLEVTAPLTQITGDVTITGTLTAGGVAYNTHVHAQGNDSDGDAEQDTTGPMNP